MLSPTNSVRFAVSFRARQAARHLQNLRDRKRFATKRTEEPLHVIVQEHSTPIYRALRGLDSKLIDNKRTNLRLAARELDGILLHPGQVFSFWCLVGPPTSDRGFVPGLTILAGRPAEDIGGGLCQISNSLHWIALHSELRVIERHRHSLDLFPDVGRSVPFGTGATVFYNYKDFRLYNPTNRAYQVRVSVTELSLNTALHASEPESARYQVREEGHEFIDQPDGLYRRNAIWREAIDPQKNRIGFERLFTNNCKCQYARGELGL